MANTVPMTPPGLKKIKEDLQRYKTVERPQNIRDIETARAHGDLSENAEYSAAKERQSHIAGRIDELEDVIARAEVIDPTSIVHDRVVFGATVTLNESENDEEITYQIVGIYESDVKAGRISIESPLAKSLIGKREAELVVMQTPRGTKEYEILSIEFK